MIIEYGTEYYTCTGTQVADSSIPTKVMDITGTQLLVLSFFLLIIGMITGAMANN